MLRKIALFALLASSTSSLQALAASTVADLRGTYEGEGGCQVVIEPYLDKQQREQVDFKLLTAEGFDFLFLGGFESELELKEQLEIALSALSDGFAYYDGGIPAWGYWSFDFGLRLSSEGALQSAQAETWITCTGKWKCEHRKFNCAGLKKL